MSTQLKIGAASVDIAPENPALLSMPGLNRSGPALGNIPELHQHADAMVFQSGDDLFVIVTNDSGGIDHEEELLYRQAIVEKIGCDPLKIIVAGRHNHSSWAYPADENNPESVAAHEAWRKHFFDGTVQAAVDAYNNLRPAEIAAGQAPVTQPIGQNRRMVHSTGGVSPMWNSGAITIPGEKLVGPAGPDATEIDFLFAREPGADKPFAVLTSYPAHIHLSGIPYFSAEAVGGIKNALQELIPGITLVYAIGALGDLDMHTVHPQPVDDGDIELQWFRDAAQTLGQRFASDLVNAMPTDGYTQPSSFKYAYYTTENLDPRTSRRYELNAFAIGDTAILSIPHELFIEFGLQMHSQNPFDNLIPIAFSGSKWLGYMGTPFQYEQGGYELSRGIAPSPEEEQRLIDEGSENRLIGKARIDTGTEITRNAVKLLDQLAAQ